MRDEGTRGTVRGARHMQVRGEGWGYGVTDGGEG